MAPSRRLLFSSLSASLALALALALVAPAAFAQTTPASPARQAAGLHFRAGVDAYQRGEHAAALAEFQSAYRIAPHHAVRVNIANCYMHLGRPIDALNHFESFLSEASAAGGVQPQQRREVTAQIAELRGQVAEIRVRVEPASARDPIVSVDGQRANTAGAVRMMPGRHTVEVSADGYAMSRQELTVTAGQREDVSVALRAASSAAATLVTTSISTTPTTGTSSGPDTSRPPVESSASGSSTGAVTTPSSTGGAAESATVPPMGSTPPADITPPSDTRRGLPPIAFISATAGTGAFAIGWGVFGGLALSANGQFNTIANRTPIDVAAGTAAANRARTFALVSDVMLGLTVAGAATSTLLLLNTRWGAARTVALMPMPIHGGAGLALGGSL
jgi:hypothetical protein